MIARTAQRQEADVDMPILRLLVLVSLFATCGPADAWWDSAWSQRRKLTFNNGAQNENLDGFPVLVKLTAANFDFSKARTAGEDLRFLDADDSTVLPHEIERYDPGTQQAEIWVRVPRIDALSAIDHVYVYFGNPGAADGQNAAGVWSTNYVAVWHLQQNPAGAPPQMLDSTSSARHATASGGPTATTAGRIDGALSFDGSDDHLEAGTFDVVAGGVGDDGLTLEAWFNADTLTTDHRLVSKAIGTSNDDHWWMLSTTNETGPNRLRFRLKAGGSTTKLIASSGDLSTGTWCYAVATYDGASMRLFRNAAPVGSTAKTGAIDANAAAAVWLAENPPGGNRRLDGILDEVRISNVARSAAWISAQHLSMTDAFVTYGAEEGWWDDDWCLRRKLTFNNAGQGANLIDFPVLVRLTAASFDFDVAQAAGQDLRFIDADNATLLAHEIERWDAGNQVAEVWVRVPRIDAGSTTDHVYVYYGNAAAADGQNPTAVWSNGYVGVWHLHQNPGGAPPQMLDSTASARHGTAVAPIAAAAGRIAEGLEFDGLDDRVDVGTFDVVPGGVGNDGLTLEGWFRADALVAGRDARLISKANGSNNNDHWWMLSLSDDGLGTFRLRMRVKTTPGNNTTAFTATGGNLSAGAWIYAVATYDGAAIRLYKDGVSAGSIAQTGTVSTNGTIGVWIGDNPSTAGSKPFDGLLDEFRVSNVARSADWVAAQHLSMTGAFVSVSASQTVGAVEGVVRAADLTPITGEAMNVRLLLGGVVRSTSAVNTADGSFRVVGATGASGQVVTVFVDGGVRKAALVTKTRGRCITGTSLVQDSLVVRSDDGGSVTNGDLDLGHDGDADLASIYPDGQGSSCALAAGKSLRVEGTYVPGGDLTVPGSLRIESAGTLRVASGSTLTLSRTKAAFPPDTHPIDGTLDVLAGNGTTPTTVRLGDHQQLVIGGRLQASDPGGGLGFGTNRYVRFTRTGAAGTGYSLHATDASVLDLKFVKFEFLYGRSDASTEVAEGTAQSAFAFSGRMSNVVAFYSVWFDELVDPGPIGATPPAENDRFPRYVYLLEDDGDSLAHPGSLTVFRRVRFDNSNSGGAADLPAPGDVRNIEKKAQTTTPIVWILNGSGTVNGDAFDVDGDTASPRDVGLYDLEFGESPTAVTLVDLRARGHDGAVLVEWETGQELENLGFSVHRSLAADGPWTRLDAELILGLGDSPTGGRYYFLDRSVRNGVRYFYRLEDVDVRGERTLHGPVEALPDAAGGAAPDSFEGYVSGGRREAEVVRSVPPPGVSGSPSGDRQAPVPSDPILSSDLETAGIRLLSYDAGGAVLEIRPPAPRFVPILEGGAIRYQVEVDGYPSSGPAGEPPLPSRTALLATPPIGGARSRILELETERRDGTPLASGRFEGLDEPGGVDPEDPADLVGGIARLRARLDRERLDARRRLLLARAEARLRLLGEPGEAEPPPAGLAGPIGRGPAGPIALGSVAATGDRTLLPVAIRPIEVALGTVVLVHRRILVRIDFLPPAPRSAGPGDDAEAMRFRLAADPGAIAIEVDRDGVQRVLAAELIRAGFDGRVDPRTLRLYHLGREVAIRVEGEDDGSLDPSDEVLFYGERNPWRLEHHPAATRHTDRNVYWLAARPGPGLRMTARPVRPAPSAVPAEDHEHVLHLERNALFYPMLDEGDGFDLWFDDRRLVGVAGRDHSLSRLRLEFDLPRLSARPHVATVELALAGVSDLAAEPDHEVEVRLAGHVLGRLVWDGRRVARSAFEVPSSLLAARGNVLELWAPSNGAGVSYDATLLDWVRVRHRRAFVAADGRIGFAGSGPASYEVRGLGEDGAVVGLEITDPLRPESLEGLEIRGGTVRFTDRSGSGRYEIRSRAAIEAPIAIRRNAPSAWHRLAAGAQWVAIAPTELLDGVRALAAARTAEGLRTAVIDVRDLYDEFTGGIPDPSAIRSLLEAAGTVRFAVLVGDGTHDPHGYVSAVDDLLPVPIRPARHLWTASDAWYATHAGDDPFPDLAIGRLPVRTPEELDAIVGRILEASPSSAPPRATLVSDDDDAAYEFRLAMDQAAAGLGAPWRVERLALGDLDAAAVRHGIRRAFEEGHDAVVWFGHGDASRWARETLLHSDQLPGWSPASRSGVVISMGCLNGMFHLPGQTSLGEACLRSPGAGARSFWGSTTLADPGEQERVLSEVLRLLATSPRRRLGAILDEARLRTFRSPGDGSDVLTAWVLLGDPAMPIR